MEDINETLEYAANAFNNAHALYLAGNFRESEEWAVIAAREYERLVNTTNEHVTELGLSWRLMGELALEAKLYEEATTVFTWALELFEKHNDLVNVMMEKSNLNRVERSKIVDAW